MVVSSERTQIQRVITLTQDVIVLKMNTHTHCNQKAEILNVMMMRSHRWIFFSWVHSTIFFIRCVFQCETSPVIEFDDVYKTCDSFFRKCSLLRIKWHVNLLRIAVSYWSDCNVIRRRRSSRKAMELMSTLYGLLGHGACVRKTSSVTTEKLSSCHRHHNHDQLWSSSWWGDL